MGAELFYWALNSAWKLFEKSVHVNSKLASIFNYKQTYLRSTSGRDASIIYLVIILVILAQWNNSRFKTIPLLGLGAEKLQLVGAQMNSLACVTDCLRWSLGVPSKIVLIPLFAGQRILDLDLCAGVNLTRNHRPSWGVEKEGCACGKGRVCLWTVKETTATIHKHHTLAPIFWPVHSLHCTNYIHKHHLSRAVYPQYIQGRPGSLSEHPKPSKQGCLSDNYIALIILINTVCVYPSTSRAVQGPWQGCLSHSSIWKCILSLFRISSQKSRHLFNSCRQLSFVGCSCLGFRVWLYCMQIGLIWFCRQ